MKARTNEVNINKEVTAVDVNSMEIITLPANKLLSAPYQRPVDQKKIRNIMRKFNKNKVKPIIVSYRNGSYYVVDRQHTLTVLRMMFGNKAEVCVRVIRGMTSAEEAEYYYSQYEDCTNLSPMEMLKARMESDDKAKNMSLACKDAGYLLATEKGTERNRIACISTFEKVYDKLGNEDTNAMLKLMREVWDGDKNATSSAFLSGMGEFYRLYGDKIKPKRFVKVMSQVAAIDVLNEAARTHIAATKSDKVTSVLVDHYNYMCKTKLPALSSIK